MAKSSLETLEEDAPDLHAAVLQAISAARRGEWGALDAVKARLVHEQDDAEPRRAMLIEDALTEMDKLNRADDPTAGMDAGTREALTTHAPPPPQFCECGALVKSPIHENVALDGYHAARMR
jgi:hypothetical protein